MQLQIYTHALHYLYRRSHMYILCHEYTHKQVKQQLEINIIVTCTLTFDFMFIALHHGSWPWAGLCADLVHTYIETI